ncbi:MAG TPA: phosphate acyltransferase, partial [Candidatus Bilamarchaeaceae archaeon]|nr:phosphate acyltransferase [Candidatus Bilamarchaeaceae archaeon]
MGAISLFGKKAWKGCRIALPEGEDERVLRAAEMARDKGLASPLLVGERRKIEAAAKKFGVGIGGIPIVDASGGVPGEYLRAYGKIRKAAPRVAERILSNPLFLAALMVRMGEADGMVAGAAYTSADVITASEGIIGLRKGISVPSSFFIMEVPGYRW